MKKLVAVLAVFAMVATAAYAQASVTGMLGVRTDVIAGCPAARAAAPHGGAQV